jgi:enolase-phosphatase E1
LQGRIWAAGYADGTLRADVFDDVPPALRRWAAAGKSTSIYSSGSVGAQKLLFGHTHYGDLMPLLSGYFDTTTGPKKEAQSYRLIAAAMGVEPGRILFATDVVAEADAAVAAGLQAVILDRPGNRPQPDHSHAVAADFNELG